MYCGYRIFRRGGLGQYFLVMPNLRPKNFLEFFYVHSALDSEFFRRGSWPTCFGYAKFETKKLFGIVSFIEHSGL